MLLALPRLLRGSGEKRRAQGSSWGLLKGLCGAVGSELRFFLTFPPQGGSLARYLEVAAGPPPTETSAAQSPVCGCGKDGGRDKRKRAQQAIGSNSELASRFPQQLFAGSSAVVFYSLLTSVQRCFPHLPAGVITSDLVTAQCSKSTD